MDEYEFLMRRYGKYIVLGIIVSAILDYALGQVKERREHPWKYKAEEKTDEYEEKGRKDIVKAIRKLREELDELEKRVR